MTSMRKRKNLPSHPVLLSLRLLEHHSRQSLGLCDDVPTPWTLEARYQCHRHVHNVAD